jgi:hypothetical protein
VFLRTVGWLLIVLGIVHLVATPHIPGLLRGSPRAVYQQAVGPTLLNHVLVGILLFPFGFTTWLAVAEAKAGKVWAGRVLIVNTIRHAHPADIDRHFHAPPGVLLGTVPDRRGPGRNHFATDGPGHDRPDRGARRRAVRRPLQNGPLSTSFFGASFSCERVVSRHSRQWLLLNLITLKIPVPGEQKAQVCVIAGSRPSILVRIIFNLESDTNVVGLERQSQRNL